MELTRLRRYLRQEVEAGIDGWQECKQVLGLLDAADEVREQLESYEIDLRDGSRAPGSDDLAFLAGQLTQALLVAIVGAVGMQTFVRATVGNVDIDDLLRAAEERKSELERQPDYFVDPLGELDDHPF